MSASNLEAPSFREATASVNEQVNKLEYDTLIEEYRRVDERILRRLEYDEKSYELTLLTFGAVVGASAIIVDQQVYPLLLVLAIPFHLLIWAQVKRTILGFHYGVYLRNVLIPRISHIIKINAANEGVEHTLFWEEYAHSAYKRLIPEVGIIGRLPTVGKTAIQFSAAIILVVAYFTIRSFDPQYIPSPFDNGLLVLNVIICLISLISIWNAFQSLRNI